jgi:hypothetical protein
LSGDGDITSDNVRGQQLDTGGPLVYDERHTHDMIFKADHSFEKLTRDTFWGHPVGKFGNVGNLYDEWIGKAN